MSQNRPGNAALLQLINGDLTSESAVRLVEDVLGGDLETFAEVIACEEKVERGWGNDDLCNTSSAHCSLEDGSLGVRTDIRVKLCVAKVGDNICNGLDIAIPSLLSDRRYCDMLVPIAQLVTYILKLPPTKNWRTILTV